MSELRARLRGLYVGGADVDVDAEDGDGDGGYWERAEGSTQDECMVVEMSKVIVRDVKKRATKG